MTRKTMVQEIVCTNAKEGLDPGSSGYCTVVRSPGLSRRLQHPLETLNSLSGGRHDGYVHAAIDDDGSQRHLVGRLKSPGMNTSRRTAVCGHFLFVDHNELPKAGPAWLASQSIYFGKWEDEPCQLYRAIEIPEESLGDRASQAWKKLTGDTAWAAALGEAATDGAPVWVVYPSGMSALQLFLEATLQLPEEDRWKATFATDFDSETFPQELSCLWRGVPEGSREIAWLREHTDSRIINLTGSGGSGRPAPRRTMGRQPVPESSSSSGYVSGSSESQPAPATEAASSPPARRKSNRESLVGESQPARRRSRPTRSVEYVDEEETAESEPVARRPAGRRGNEKPATQPRARRGLIPQPIDEEAEVEPSPSERTRRSSPPKQERAPRRRRSNQRTESEPETEWDQNPASEELETESSEVGFAEAPAEESAAQAEAPEPAAPPQERTIRRRRQAKPRSDSRRSVRRSRAQPAPASDEPDLDAGHSVIDEEDEYADDEAAVAEDGDNAHTGTDYDDPDYDDGEYGETEYDEDEYGEEEYADGDDEDLDDYDQEFTKRARARRTRVRKVKEPKGSGKAVSEKPIQSGSRASLSMHIDGRKAAIIAGVVALIGVGAVYGPTLFSGGTTGGPNPDPDRDPASLGSADERSVAIVQNAIGRVRRKAEAIRRWDGVASPPVNLDETSEEMQSAASDLKSTSIRAQLESIRKDSPDEYAALSSAVASALSLSESTVDWLARIRAILEVLTKSQQVLEPEQRTDSPSEEELKELATTIEELELTGLPQPLKQEVARHELFLSTAEGFAESPEPRLVVFPAEKTPVVVDREMPRVGYLDTFSIAARRLVPPKKEPEKTPARTVDCSVEEVASDVEARILRRFLVYDGETRVAELLIRGEKEREARQKLELLILLDSRLAREAAMQYVFSLKGPVLHRAYRFAEEIPETDSDAPEKPRGSKGTDES